MQQIFNRLILSCTLFISLAQANEAVEMSFNDLPDVIQQSARHAFPNRSITQITHSIKGNSDFFTLTSIRNGNSKSVTFANDGMITHTEQTFTKKKKPIRECKADKPASAHNEHDFYSDVEGYKQDDTPPDCHFDPNQQ